MNEVEGRVLMRSFGYPPTVPCDCQTCSCQIGIGVLPKGKEITTCPPCSDGAHEETSEREVWVVKFMIVAGDELHFACPKVSR
jgi:hypothetical protein